MIIQETVPSSNNKSNQQTERKEKVSKGEQLASLKNLRRRGILTRQQFRLMTFERSLQGSTKGSPMITEYTEVKDKVDGRKVLVTQKQWTRI